MLLTCCWGGKRLKSHTSESGNCYSVATCWTIRVTKPSLCFLPRRRTSAALFPAGWLDTSPSPLSCRPGAASSHLPGVRVNVRSNKCTKRTDGIARPEREHPHPHHHFILISEASCNLIVEVRVRSAVHARTQVRGAQHAQHSHAWTHEHTCTKISHNLRNVLRGVGSGNAGLEMMWTK